MSSGLSKGMAGLKVSRGRSGSIGPDGKPTKAKVTKVRRRFSVVTGDPKKKAYTTIDGTTRDGKESKRKRAVKKGGAASSNMVEKFYSVSNVGYVPFNPNKVNQDRACEVENFGKDQSKSFFGVFDGHGSLGHEVSAFVAEQLPKHFLKQRNLDKDPPAAITKAFIECNSKLAKGSIDCTFSGTTVITCYLVGNKLYSANAGDSRAVLGRKGADGNFKAVALSDDQKPEREDEKKRIIASRGRVEACKGLQGEDIGPARVWLLNQDVPGLAMTRSFGDLIAASVGVIPRPEVWETELTPSDGFMILASDGVWEFISSQEAVDIVQSANGNAEVACQLLYEESTRRWKEVEEVIDDITALVVFFKGHAAKDRK